MVVIITDTRTVDDGYQGVDSDRDRDMEAEVTTMLGFYPEVLTQTKEQWNSVPIQYLASTFDNENIFLCNTKAVSFVPFFAELAMKFNSFEEHERGGNGKSINLLIRYILPYSFGDDNRIIENVRIVYQINLFITYVGQMVINSTKKDFGS